MKNKFFKDGLIHDVITRELSPHVDERGWLAEVFRRDELPSEELAPRMSYVSITRPGVKRGPHEHVAQWDMFCFPGPGVFRVFLWDAREDSPTCCVRQIVECGENRPMVIMIPPGVVHGYKNISSVNALVINYPNKLYAGFGKKEEVDEIRHEDDPETPYIMEE